MVLDSLGAGLVGILVPLWFFIAACGFTFPQVQVLGLANHGKEAGTAASLLGALNFGLAGLISPVVGFLGIGTAVPMGSVMIVHHGRRHPRALAAGAPAHRPGARH